MQVVATAEIPVTSFQVASWMLENTTIPIKGLHMIQSTPDVAASNARIGASTRITVFQERLKLVIVLNMTESMLSVSAGPDPEVLLQSAFDTVCNTILGVCKPFKHPQTEKFIEPSILLTVVLFEGFNHSQDSESPFRIPIHHVTLTGENCEKMLEILAAELHKFKVKAFSKTSPMPSRLDAEHFTTKNTFHILEFALFCLSCMSNDYPAAILFVTDGVSSSSGSHDSIPRHVCQTIVGNRVNVVIVQVGADSGFSPKVALGYVPNQEFLRFVCESSGGSFYYHNDLPLISDGQPCGFYTNLFFFRDFSLRPVIDEKRRPVDFPQVRLINTNEQSMLRITREELGYPWDANSKPPMISKIICGYRDYRLPHLAKLKQILRTRFAQGFILENFTRRHKKDDDRVEIVLSLAWLQHVSIMYTLKFTTTRDSSLFDHESLKKSFKVELHLLAEHSFAILFVNLHDMDNRDVPKNSLADKLVSIHIFLQSICDNDQHIKVLSDFTNVSWADVPVDPNSSFVKYLVNSEILHPSIYVSTSKDVILKSASSVSKQFIEYTHRKRRQEAMAHICQTLGQINDLTFSKTCFIKFIGEAGMIGGFIITQLHTKAECLVTIKWHTFGLNSETRAAELSYIFDELANKQSAFYITQHPCHSPFITNLKGSSDTYELSRAYLRHLKWVWFADCGGPGISEVVRCAFSILYLARIREGFLISNDTPLSTMFYREASLHDFITSFQYRITYDEESSVLYTELWVDPYLNCDFQSIFEINCKSMYERDYYEIMKVFAYFYVQNAAEIGMNMKSAYSPDTNYITTDFLIETMMDSSSFAAVKYGPSLMYSEPSHVLPEEDAQTPLPEDKDHELHLQHGDQKSIPEDDKTPMQSTSVTPVPFASLTTRTPIASDYTSGSLVQTLGDEYWSCVPAVATGLFNVTAAHDEAVISGPCAISTRLLTAKHDSKILSAVVRGYLRAGLACALDTCHNDISVTAQNHMLSIISSCFRVADYSSIKFRFVFSKALSDKKVVLVVVCDFEPESTIPVAFFECLKPDTYALSPEKAYDGRILLDGHLKVFRHRETQSYQANIIDGRYCQHVGEGLPTDFEDECSPFLLDIQELVAATLDSSLAKAFYFSIIWYNSIEKHIFEQGQRALMSTYFACDMTVFLQILFLRDDVELEDDLQSIYRGILTRDFAYLRDIDPSSPLMYYNPKEFLKDDLEAALLLSNAPLFLSIECLNLPQENSVRYEQSIPRFSSKNATRSPFERADVPITLQITQLSLKSDIGSPHLLAQHQNSLSRLHSEITEFISDEIMSGVLYLRDIELLPNVLNIVADSFKSCGPNQYYQIISPDTIENVDPLSSRLLLKYICTFDDELLSPAFFLKDIVRFSVYDVDIVGHKPYFSIVYRAARPSVVPPFWITFWLKGSCLMLMCFFREVDHESRVQILSNFFGTIERAVKSSNARLALKKLHETRSAMRNFLITDSDNTEKDRHECPCVFKMVFSTHWRLDPDQVLVDLLVDTQGLSIINRPGFLVLATEHSYFYLKLSTFGVKTSAELDSVDKPEKGILLQVFGVDSPNTEICVDFVNMIEERIQTMLRIAISTYISRNVNVRLTTPDVEFLFSSDNTFNAAFLLPKDLENPFLFSVILRQALLKDLKAIRGPNVHFVLKSFYEKKYLESWPIVDFKKYPTLKQVPGQ